MIGNKGKLFIPRRVEFDCTFCGKRHREVKKLFSGPRVFICDECVVLFHDILREDERIEGA